MSTNDSFTWGAESLSRGHPEKRQARPAAHRRSLMRARMSAVIIDGLVLLVPVFGIAWILARVFPHHGFFFSRSAGGSPGAGSTTSHYTLGPPGWLVISALSLSYFYLAEVVRGQTVGKRAMGLTVRSASGGRAGINAVSARTVLRLIDALPFLYLVGALVAIVTGARRRRIGDWAGGTVVVHESDVADDPPGHPSWRVAIYPVGWLCAVLFAVFALGLGKAAGEGEEAIALVQSYVKAREHGDAALACSMLTREQQRELAALQSHDNAATPGLCTTYILGSDPHSHLLNPDLPEVAASPLASQYTPLGAVVVRSQYPPTELIAVPEDGQLKLDMRGVERLSFLRQCTAAGKLSSMVCACTFAWIRVQEVVPEVEVNATIVRAIVQDRVGCQRNPTALPD
jgi:uncharacterized RDD family membrane protein YckC